MDARDLHARIARRLRAVYGRTRYRLGLPEWTPSGVRHSATFRHPVDASRRQANAERYRRLFPGAAERELAAAARLMSHEFSFLGYTTTHGTRINWSQDPVSGKDWSRGYSPEIAYRGPARLGDIKFPWELSKHQYFFTLGKAAWLSGDDRYAREIVHQIDDWIAANPFRRGVNWISALEVGTRAVSWILAFPFYASCADAAFADRLTASLAQHMHFVESHISVGRFANNHLIGDAASLVAGGLFLDGNESTRWIDTGLHHLEEQMRKQVEPDGVHVERSVSYHRFVLDQYHLIASLLTANGRSFSEPVQRGMERMTDFLMDVIAPDGRSPGFGDGDDARGFWVQTNCTADFRSTLALGAALFGRGDFKAVAGPLSEDVFWLYGDAGVAAFENVTPHSPAHTSVAYPDGGYYVMRQGWNLADAVTVVDCGPLGYGPAGHGHADALSFHLHASGYPFIVDPGAFSYNLDYAWRDAFRSTRAHNTIVVDGQDQSVPADRMAWSLAAKATTRRWLTTEWFDLIDGEHDGYRRLPDPVTHRRTLAYLKEGVWIVRDALTSAGRHSAELLFHLAPDCHVMRDAHGGCTLQSPAGAALRALTVDSSGNVLPFTILTGTDNERGAWISPAYGTRVPSRTLSVRTDVDRECVLTTYLWIGDVDGPAIAQKFLDEVINE